MTAFFILASTVLLLLALAVVLLPLLRSPLRAQHARLHKAFRQGLLTPEEFAAKFQSARRNDQQHNQPARTKLLAALLVITLPLAAYLIYQQVGTPSALQLPGAAASHPSARSVNGIDPSATAELVELEERTRQAPDNRLNWMRLASAYSQQSRFEESSSALRQALELTPEDAPERADMLASLAENQLFSSAGNVSDQAIDNIQQALRIDPQNPRALWLAGAVAFQNEDYRGAIGHWQTLLPLIDDTVIKDTIQQQLDQALTALHSQLGIDSNVAPTKTDNDDSSTAVATAPVVAVNIEFNDALKAALAGHTGAAPVLFIFARQPDVPGPPLAIQRIANPQPPLQTILDNSQAMVPGNDLASIGSGGEVEIVARLSWSGNASPMPGDWQASSRLLLSDTTVNVALLLDQPVN